MNKIKSAEDGTQIGTMCRQFVMESSDMEDMSKVVRYVWMREDAEGARAAINELYQSKNKEPKYMYLMGLIEEDVMKKREYALNIFNIDASARAGYELLAEIYTAGFFMADDLSDDKMKLKKTLHEDHAYFDKMLSLENPSMTMSYSVFEYLLYMERLDEALNWLEKARSTDQDWVSDVMFARVYARKGEYSKAKKSSEAAVENFITKGQVKAEDKETIVRSLYSYVLIDSKAYDQALEYTKSLPDAETDSSSLYTLACIYALKGESDLAIENLNKAAKYGWDQVDHTKSDPDLIALHDHPRWEESINNVQAAYDRGAESRRKESLAQKIEKDAPLWSLKDNNGTLVKLEDFKGSIVILDFWATWCRPCLMAMPVLDKWCKEKKPENVKVFSINVFERNVKKAVEIFEKQSFAMTLLYGNDDVAKAYGVEGIPYICVIDKQGKIRFEERGFSPLLADNLDIWIADLNK
ncbi:redoxin domain-containing protein [bacterium]|nr:redoxin domain-containing protein [candidate division CSSED10-310 bacterium]